MRQGLLLAFAVWAVCCGWNQARATEVPELVTNSHQFSIPFRYNAAELQRYRTPSIHLYVSRDAGKNWQKVQTVSVQQKEFQFRPAVDGTYWFTVALSNSAEDKTPDAAHSQPGLKVVVDRQPPALSLQFREVQAGQLSLEWQAADDNLVPESLSLEYRNSPQQDWKTVYIQPQAAGKTTWKYQGGEQPEVRGRITDVAGNARQAHALLQRQTLPTIAVVEPVIESVPSSVPELELDFPASIKQDSTSQDQIVLTLSPQQPPAQSTAADYLLPQISPGVRVSMPREESVTPAAGTDQQPVLLAPAVAERSRFPQAEQGQGQETVNFPPQAVRADSRNVKPVMANQPAALNSVSGSTGRISYMNSREFQIEYQVTGIGPSGVGVVELFITQDNGAQWWRYGVDPDLTSPMEVKVPEDGHYGFLFRIHSGVGNAEAPPQPGQAPQIQVVVDSASPKLDLLKVYQGHGEHLGLLTVQWNYTDTHPAEKPISLFISGHQQGPWQQVDGTLENTGSHTFRLPNHVSPRLYTKICGTDAAGNVSEVISADPVLIDLAKPSARVIMIDVIR